MEIIESREKEQTKVECQAELAEALLKAKRTEEADQLFAEADSRAAALADPAARGFAYLALGKKLRSVRRTEEFRAALAKADEAATKIKDAKIRGQLIVEIKVAQK
jgi:hypothetical protein